MQIKLQRLLVIFFLVVPSIWAQKSPVPGPAPVPPRIQAANKIFISNLSGESIEAVIKTPALTGGPDRPYNQFYAAMKELKRYEIVTSPADADLIFEVGWELGHTGLELPALGQLRVAIVDPKTHVTLWRFSEYVPYAVRLGNRDKNFDRAMDALIKRVKDMAESLEAGAN